MNIVRNRGAVIATNFCRSFSVSSVHNATHSCKLLVIGGGSGGCTMAAKFMKRLKTKDSVIVLEPSKDHYYQPLFTLIGGGVTNLKESHRREKDVLPKGVKWIQDYAEDIMPDENKVRTREGHLIDYEYIIVSVGLVMNYEKVPGMYEALQDPNSRVSTIYTPDHAEKVFSDMKCFKGGEAIFTYPKSLVKCPGAPQKIAYLADAYFRKTNIRSKANITYATCAPFIFGVPKYSKELDKVAKRKNINVDLEIILKEIRHDRKEIVLHKCDNEDNTTTRRYDMLHVVPHQQTPDVIRMNPKIADDFGYLDVDKYTLQHNRYPNMYGIGDCTSTPNSKTAAAIAKQSLVVEHNLLSTMQNDSPKDKYDGYGACPLVTSYNTCILAEFTYGGVPHETMPWDQSKESVMAYYMKRHLFPFIYWHFMLKGLYNGPGFVRKIVNPMGW